MNSRNLHIILLLLFIEGILKALPTGCFGGNNQNGDVFGSRVFVENTGQYDRLFDPTKKVFYALDNGVEKIYFTKRGPIYVLTKFKKLNEREREELEEGKLLDHKIKITSTLEMIWLNADTNHLTMVASDKQSHYITHGFHHQNANTYKTLTYKNIYPLIDLEYIIPDDKPCGVKYSFIVHPGANPNIIKGLYSGSDHPLVKTKSEELYIRTNAAKLIESAPRSFDDKGGRVKCIWNLQGDTLGFLFPEGYDTKSTLIIDPWVNSGIVLGSNNAAYDVDYDFTGNLYVYGGMQCAKVAKYSSAGVLLWTFSGTVTPINWNSQPTIYIGNFGVDKNSGKCLVGQGQSPSGSTIIRLDANGNYDNFVTTANSQYQEIWDMGFTCLTGDVFTLGGGHLSNSSAATINTVNFTANLTTFQPQNTGGHQDIASHAIDDQGVVFVAYSTNGNSPLQNKLCKVGNGLGTQIWTQPNTFGTMIEVGNKTQYLPLAIYSNGFNCLAVNSNYLFYYDGRNLGAYSKTTGSLTASTFFNLQTIRGQGGIAVDDCNNIYLGGNGSIQVMHFNGSNFTFLSSINIGASNTNSKVFDIRFDKANKLLYACGNGFAGTYNAAASLTCGLVASNCVFAQNQVNISSSAASCSSIHTATASITGGIGPFTYSWIPSGQTGSVATGLASGIHILIANDIGANQTYTTYVNLVTVSTISFNVIHTPVVSCLGVHNGTASVSGISGGNGNYLVTWGGNGFAATGTFVTGLTAGNYFVTVTDTTTGCTNLQMFNIGQSAPFGANILGNINGCIGSTISVTAYPFNGVGPFTYSWSNGFNTAQIALTSSVSSQQSYSCIITNSIGCQTIVSTFINFLSPPQISTTSDSVCPNQIGMLHASGANSYTWNGISPGANFYASTYVSQAYTVVGSANGCTAQAIAYIHIKPVPSPTLSSNQPVCKGSQLVLSAEGGTAFAWTGPSGFNSSLNTNSINPTTSSHNGVYSVQVTGLNSCSVLASIAVNLINEPSVSNFSLSACSNQVVYLSANVGTNVLLYHWTGPQNFISSAQIPCLLYPSSLASGVYSLLITSVEGCTNQAFAQLTVTALPDFTPHVSAPVCEGQLMTMSVASQQNGLTFNWNGPAGFVSAQSNYTFNAVQLNEAGIYTLNMTYGPCANASTVALVVYANPQPTITSQIRVCEKSGHHFQVIAGPGNLLNTATWQGPYNYNAQGLQATLASASLSSSGIYSVSVTDIHSCSGSDTTLLIVMNQPTLIVEGDTACLFSNPTIRAYGASTYTWYNQSGIINQQPAVQLPPLLNLTTNSYTVVGTAINSCTNSGIAKVYVNPVPTPSLRVSPSTTACLNNPFTFTGLGAEQYVWSGPKGFSAKGSNVTFTPGAISLAGTYSLTGFNGFGCSATRTTNITLHDLPHGQLLGDTLGHCAPFCSKFLFKQQDNELPITQIQWKIGNQFFQGSKFDFCFREPGVYPIVSTYTDSNGCMNTNSILAHAWPRPVADFSFSPNKPIENQDVVTFIALTTEAQSFYWEISTPINEFDNTLGTSIYSTREARHLFVKEGIFAVALLVSNEKGCTDTVVKKVKVESDFTVFIPNCFTPNGDHQNEEFGPVMTGIKKFELNVFNRWGQKIYVSGEPNAFWDGNYKGTPCKEDVYNYTLSILTRSGIEKHFSGHVTLLR